VHSILDGDSLNCDHLGHRVPERILEAYNLPPEQRFVQLSSSSPRRPTDQHELELSDSLDVPPIQSLMNDFYAIVRIPMGVSDMKGKALAGVGWQEICTDFHRVNPETRTNCIESETQFSAGIPPGECKLYHCKNNMWDFATPLVVNGLHLGNVFMGQFFFDDEPLDYGIFREQARRYGFDEQQYLAALNKVPRLSRDTVNRGMSFLMKLAQVISSMGYSRLTLTQALAERKRSEEALIEREAVFHALFDTIPLSVALIDTQTLEFLQFNDAAAENLGYTREEFATLTVNDIEAFVSPQQLRKIIDERSPAGDLVVLETKHKTKSGAVRDVVVNYRIITNDARPVSHCVWEDVTEKKVAEAALLQSDKLASVGRMAATVAHEINNPLEAVTNCVYLVSTSPLLAPELKEHLKIAERELHRAAHIAKQTLGFYRENSRPAVVDIRSLVDEVVEIYSSKLKPKDIRLKIEHDGRCEGTIAIAGEIRQVISNLLTNAIDASRHKGIVKIRTSRVTLNGDSYTRMTVADVGDGISRANRSRIFEPFFTTKLEIGTGLGLWVSSEIVQKHKGQIRFHSIEGSGTVFAGCLPIPALMRRYWAEAV